MGHVAFKVECGYGCACVARSYKSCELAPSGNIVISDNVGAPSVGLKIRADGHAGPLVDGHTKRNGFAQANISDKVVAEDDVLGLRNGCTDRLRSNEERMGHFNVPGSEDVEVPPLTGVGNSVRHLMAFGDG